MADKVPEAAERYSQHQQSEQLDRLNESPYMVTYSGIGVFRYDLRHADEKTLADECIRLREELAELADRWDSLADETRMQWYNDSATLDDCADEVRELLKGE